MSADCWTPSRPWANWMTPLVIWIWGDNGASLEGTPAGIVAIYDRQKSDTVNATLTNAVKKSVAQVDGGGAPNNSRPPSPKSKPAWAAERPVHRRRDPLVLAIRNRDQSLNGTSFAVAVCCRRWKHNLKNCARTRNRTNDGRRTSEQSRRQTSPNLGDDKPSGPFVQSCTAEFGSKSDQRRSSSETRG